MKIDNVLLQNCEFFFINQIQYQQQMQQNENISIQFNSVIAFQDNQNNGLLGVASWCTLFINLKICYYKKWTIQICNTVFFIIILNYQQFTVFDSIFNNIVDGNDITNYYLIFYVSI
eukprot:TRINITY_DN2435_c0_g1_i3.p5 TRINITY_DN2435_c0_g1~~TRINITY_DN2435_c0_g1_i3.p5  ORF type:complete len:117 (-),score=0.13 TRINITY_DN2435_c0_g1_i3:466-816(-)